MKAIQTASLAATCLHIQTGSSKVFANGLGVSRCKEDTAGGKIQGPGSSLVIVEGKNASVVGDMIKSHAPCPFPATHCAAYVNIVGQGSVIVGVVAGSHPPRNLGNVFDPMNDSIEGL
jgi:uncharacterized Zn-binding protein involved in type VI secretion